MAQSLIEENKSENVEKKESMMIKRVCELKPRSTSFKDLQMFCQSLKEHSLQFLFNKFETQLNLLRFENFSNVLKGKFSIWPN